MPRMIWAAILLIMLASPALATTGRCMTYEQKSLGQWQTLCDDGTRAVSCYNRVFNRYETTVTESPRPHCAGRLNPVTKQVELRCR